MIASSTAVLDTGPLTAAADAGDPDHARCVEVLQRIDFVIPALVVAEATYLLSGAVGPQAEARFIRGLERFDVVGPTPRDFVRMAELMERYADFPLGGTDASVIALAERLGVDTIITLDRRHFSVVRPRHVERFTLLPA